MTDARAVVEAMGPVIEILTGDLRYGSRTKNIKPRAKGAAPGDRVSGEALRQRAREHAGDKQRISSNGPNNPPISAEDCKRHYGEGLYREAAGILGYQGAHSGTLSVFRTN
jgi:hypothetical protein